MMMAGKNQCMMENIMPAGMCLNCSLGIRPLRGGGGRAFTCGLVGY